MTSQVNEWKFCSFSQRNDKIACIFASVLKPNMTFIHHFSRMHYSIACSPYWKWRRGSRCTSKISTFFQINVEYILHRIVVVHNVLLMTFRLYNDSLVHCWRWFSDELLPKFMENASSRCHRCQLSWSAIQLFHFPFDVIHLDSPRKFWSGLDGSREKVIPSNRIVCNAPRAGEMLSRFSASWFRKILIRMNAQSPTKQWQPVCESAMP